MSGHRSNDQTLIAVPISKAFLQEIDSVRGDQSRSAFVRAALLEKMKTFTSLPKEMSYAPSRTGKGGKPTHKSKALEPVAGSGEAKQNKVAG